MLKLAQIKTELRAGQYTWPGAYPKFFLCEDGETLSFESVRENWREICRAHIGRAKGYRDPQWTLAAVDVNWEDGEMVCAHSGKRIESAYAETD